MHDSGHFAVEDSLEEIAGQIKRSYGDKIDVRSGARAVEPMASTR